MALPHHNNEDGSVEGTFIFHSPTNLDTWYLNITFITQYHAKSLVDVAIFHSYGEEILVAMCENDTRSDWTTIKNPWSNSSHLNSSHNITLQVRGVVELRGSFPVVS